MTDESFHLTPHDIRGQEFQKVLRGYDIGQVESFKQRVADELDRVMRERLQLDERLKSHLEQLRSFRERDRAINDALVSAQQLRADIQAQSGREAEGVLKEAQAEAARILERAAEEEQAAHQRIEAVTRQFSTYVGNLRGLLDRHQAELSGLEAYLEPPAQAERSRSHA
jgi:DivIVA domain-containing protein